MSAGTSRSGEAAAQSASLCQVRIGVRRRAGGAVARQPMTSAAATTSACAAPDRPAASSRRSSAAGPRSSRTADAGRRLFKMHDRHDLAVVLAAVEPVAHRLDQSRDGLAAADGGRL